MRNFNKHYRHIKKLVTNYKGKTSSFNAKLQKNTLSNSCGRGSWIIPVLYMIKMRYVESNWTVCKLIFVIEWFIKHWIKTEMNIIH